jgi:hypothetical protein
VAIVTSRACSSEPRRFPKMLIDGTTSCLRRSAGLVARLLAAFVSLVTAASLAGSTGAFAGTRTPEVSHVPPAASVCPTCWSGTVHYYYEASSKNPDSHASDTETIDVTLYVPQSPNLGTGSFKETVGFPYSVNCPGSRETIDETGTLASQQNFNFDPVATTENGNIDGYSIGDTEVWFIVNAVTRITAGKTPSGECRDTTNSENGVRHVEDVPRFFVADRPHQTYAKALKLRWSKQLHQDSTPNACTTLGPPDWTSGEPATERCSATLTWDLHRKATP